MEGLKTCLDSGHRSEREEIRKVRLTQNTAPMRPPLPTAPAHARRLDAEALTITHINGAPETPPTMCGSTPGAWHGAAGTRAAALLRTACRRSRELGRGEPGAQ